MTDVVIISLVGTCLVGIATACGVVWKVVAPLRDRFVSKDVCKTIQANDLREHEALKQQIEHSHQEMAERYQELRRDVKQGFADMTSLLKR